MKTRDFVIEMVETFVTSVIVIFLLYMFIASVEEVWGASMEPTFSTGERILVDKVTPMFQTYQRGEVVVLVPPNDDSKHYIKRVIGMPGDIVKIYDCAVYVSRDDTKFKIEEPYLASGTCTVGGQTIEEGRALKVPEGEYMVLGDNRGNSVDSRSFGFLSERKIIGRVIYRFWPLNKLGFVK